MYKPLAGFITRLTANLTTTQRYLPIPHKMHDRLVTALGDGGYSYLEIREGNTVEVVKVMNLCGKIQISRGDEGTKVTAFRCGVSVSFSLTMQGVKDMVCQMESCA